MTKRITVVGFSFVLLSAIVIMFIVFSLPAVESKGRNRTPTPSGLVTPGAPSPAPVLEQTEKVTDLAPDLQLEDKESILVQHHNGQKEWFLIDPAKSKRFRKSLSQEDTILLDAPPKSLLQIPNIPETGQPTAIMPPGLTPSPHPFPPPPTVKP